MHPVLRSTTATREFDAAPIPASWIIRGEPEARSRLLSRSLDGTTVTSHWDCTAGTFNWYFGCEETVHILEGEVHVRDETGAAYTLKAGDIAVFHADMEACWNIPTYVRKLAICRQPVPASVGFALRAWNKISRMMSGMINDESLSQGRRKMKQLAINAGLQASLAWNSVVALDYGCVLAAV